jgi:CheY-like chemotaxis protein
MLNRLIGDDIEVVSVPRDDLGTIKADPVQIEQVLMNLVANARDAMLQGGKITITTANVELDETNARQHPLAKPGPYVMLAVTDTGVGIDKETQPHIFEPFFSTKETGKGTGLGLATVFGIVKQSGGTISLHSEPGHGTTFKVYFPRHDESPVVSQEEKEMPVRLGSETLLLVDDAGPLRELTRRLLEDSGYTVLASGSPLEAIRIADQHKGALPLLITDVVMPGLSGPALAERVTAARPETRVLYTSGYTDDAIYPHGKLGPNCAFLEKPFTRDDLMRKVRELLDSPLQQSAA